VQQIPFNSILINGMLGFLLFAGAMTIDIANLREQGWEVAVLSMLGTVASTFLIGSSLDILLNLLGYHLPFIYCLLFGALISPTDPIAVLAMFKDLNAPRHMATILEGESLFNDGIGIVLFLTIYQATFNLGHPTFINVSLLFLQQAMGGLIYGLILGWFGAYLIRTTHSARLAILITIALVSGGYAMAQLLKISGPLAMVVAGLIVGNTSSLTLSIKKELNIFWDVLDEILNVVLFLLVGFEMLVMPWTLEKLIIGLFIIPLVLIVRYITVAMPISFFQRKKDYYPYFVAILTWGGLRGGLAIALALSLPRDQYRDWMLGMTYMVVLFAIVVQGLTMKPLIAKSLAKMDKAA
ncbi:MAG: cation:proton antiporter, partial [Gammaproteobacteria bacterium]